MKRKANSQHTIYIVVLLALFTFLANCGSDETAPADPSSTSEIPDIVFFNTGDPSPVFEGKAFDNFKVKTVELSFNGTGWNPAVLVPPDGDNEVDWSYPASIGDLSAPINTVVIRATDSSDNISVSDPVFVRRQMGATISSLLAVFNGPLRASTGEVVGLSSGVGGAYGNGTIGPNIPINVPLTVIGSGYGNTITSGHPSFPAVMSTATIIEWPVLSASIFSVDADLTLKNIRLLGAENAVRIVDSAGPNPQLSIEEVVFDGQAAWAVHAVDDDQVVNIQFLDSIVDASQAGSSNRGGLFLDNVVYQVEGSGFYYHTDPEGPSDATIQGAAVQVFDGAGEIADSIFEDNALAIWASGGSPTIFSCTISGAAFTTNGIDLSGSGIPPIIRNNDIQDNNGFGIRIRGNSEPKLFGNEIHSDSITYSNAVGILILDPGSLPELGKFPWDESGCNKFESSSSIIEDFVIEVDSSTSAASIIFAGNNFWGVQFDTGSEIRTYKIHDGNDPDNGSAAIVDLTGIPGGTNPIIWNGTGACP
jgi:parallel beta-helix repeat protein